MGEVPSVFITIVSGNFIVYQRISVVEGGQLKKGGFHHPLMLWLLASYTSYWVH